MKIVRDRPSPEAQNVDVAFPNYASSTLSRQHSPSSVTNEEALSEDGFEGSLLSDESFLKDYSSFPEDLALAEFEEGIDESLSKSDESLTLQRDLTHQSISLGLWRETRHPSITHALKDEMGLDGMQHNQHVGFETNTTRSYKYGLTYSVSDITGVSLSEFMAP